MKQPPKPQRAKYLTCSNPSSNRGADPGDPYAFCESATATSYSRWHIRKLDAAGLKLTGGITTESLCELVRPMVVTEGTRAKRGFGGWDLNVKFDPSHFSHACPRCVAKHEEQTRT